MPGWLRKFCALLCVGYGLQLVSVAHAQNDTSPSILQSLRSQYSPSTTWIEAALSDGGNFSEIKNGTGVVVSPDGYVLTAAHLFLRQTEEIAGTSHYDYHYKPSNQGESPLAAISTQGIMDALDFALDLIFVQQPETLSRYNVEDFAVLRLPQRMWILLDPSFRDHNRQIGVPEICLQYRPRIGETLYGIGYPNAQAQLAVRAGTVEAIVTKNNMWKLHATFDQGMSGGPLVDAKGRIVGVISKAEGNQVLVSPIRKFSRGLIEYAQARIDADCGLDDQYTVEIGTRNKGSGPSIPDLTLSWKRADESSNQAIKIGAQLVFLQELQADSACDDKCVFSFNDSAPKSIGEHLKELAEKSAHKYGETLDPRYASLASYAMTLGNDSEGVVSFTSKVLAANQQNQNFNEMYIWRANATQRLAADRQNPIYKVQLQYAASDISEYIDFAASPNDWSLLKRAEIAIDLGNEEAAVRDLEAAVDSFQTEASTLLAAGKLYQRLGYSADAMELAARVPEADPLHGSAQLLGLEALQFKSIAAAN